MPARIVTSEHGRIDVGRSEIELDGAGTADFSTVNFSPKRVDILSNSDYEVLIKVMSGRRSDKYNLLDCGTAGGKISIIRFGAHCAPVARFKEPLQSFMVKALYHAM